MTFAIIQPDDLLYPPHTPYKTGYVAIGDGHQLYYEESGNPKGVPVLILHGGPGEGIFPRSKRFYDPSYFRVIAYDQRGCGQSKPSFVSDMAKALKNNNPDALVHDIDKLRRHLKIKQWHVRGSSWGSTLALYYGMHYPQQILSMLIHAIYLHRPSDIHWYINKMGLFFPEAEAELMKQLPKGTADVDDRLPLLTDIITGKDKKRAATVAEAQGRFEYAALYLQKQIAAKEKPKMPAEKQKEIATMIALGGVECYFMQHYPFTDDWFKTKQAKAALKKIKRIEVYQGRYDVICPPKAAYELVQAHPHMQLMILDLAGHSGSELPMLSQLKQAIERLKQV